MAGDNMSFRRPSRSRGLLGSLLATANGLASFVETRLGLFGQEAKSALMHVIIMVVCVLAAAVISGVGFLFLIASLVVGLAHLLHISWAWVALGVALLQFMIALLLLVIARSRMTKPMFRASLAELKKDREWLKNLEKTKLS